MISFRHFGSVLCALSFLAISGHCIPSFTQHSIQSNYAGPWSIYAIDIDGDTDIDIVSAGRFTNTVDWWENDGEENFTKHTVSSDVLYPMGVHADDYDGDGDADIVCGADVSEEVSWFENDGEQNFTKHQIVHWPGVVYVWGDDLDRDGDPDVMAAACEATPGRMGWFENDGNGEFTEHVIMDNWNHANCVHTADMDPDGDTDLLGCASWAGEIAWFENDGEETFTEHIVLNTGARPSSVHGVDLDGDRDTDILATICYQEQIVWFENNGEQQFSQHAITSGFVRPHCVWAADLDRDGDMDMVGASINNNEISWFENDGEQEFTKHILSQSFIGATDVFVNDVDMDGDPDVLGTAQFGNELSWWENDLFTFRFQAEPRSGHASLAVQFTDLSSAVPPLTYHHWDFDNDGTIDSDDVHPMWEYLDPGYYTVSLEVGNEIISHTIVYEDYIRVFDGESAVEFDGNDGYGLCTADQIINLTEALTLEASINPTGWGEVSATGYGRIVDKGSFTLALHGEGSTYDRHSLMFIIKNESGTPRIITTPAFSIRLDEWQHIAASYDAYSSTAHLYINGIDQELAYSSFPDGTLRDNSEIDLIIGNSDSGTYTFQGIIDEIRLWSGVRTGEEIRDTMQDTLCGNETGLIAYWPLNEGCGDSASDCSTHDHELDLYSVRWAQGNHPIAVAPDGGEDPARPRVKIIRDIRPNPSSTGTSITFFIPSECHFRARITDVQGRHVCHLADGPYTPGSYTVYWYGRTDSGVGVGSGTYLVRIEYNGHSDSEKLMMIK